LLTRLLLHWAKPHRQWRRQRWLMVLEHGCPTLSRAPVLADAFTASLGETAPAVAAPAMVDGARTWVSSAFEAVNRSMWVSMTS
jgi:hypothetical protein